MYIPKKKQIVLLDVDNVLLNFNRHFRKFMVQDLGIKLPNDPVADYYPAAALGNSRGWEVEVLSAFQESQHFNNLAALPYAKASIKKLLDNGCSLIAITACGHNGLDMDKITASRIENLRSHFGEKAFSEIHIVPADRTKREHLQRYENGYWAEDGVSNAIDGHKAGHRSFIIDWPHNQKADAQGLPRIKDLRPFARHAVQGTYPKGHPDAFALRR